MVSIRIGVMGGSFDPPHEGHLRAALTALNEAKLDRVLLLPCGGTPEYGEIFASAQDRLRMLDLMISGTDGLFVSDLEVRQGGWMPTTDVMRVLRAKYPADQLSLIIGADKLTWLHQWKDAEVLFSLCDFLVLPRDQLPAEALARPAVEKGARITFLPMESQAVSSREIQDHLRLFQDPSGLHPEVAQYIAASGLYHDPALESRVRSMMTEKRFRHTLGVRTQAVMLARLHGLSMQKAALAALLHDCAKCLPFDEMKAVAQSGGIRDEELLSSPEMLHGPAASVLARRDFGVTDPDILNAISYHTMGRTGMSMLEMCIFTADATEPGRKPYPGLDRIRELSFTDLPASVLLSLLRTKAYVLEQGKRFQPLSEKTISWLKDLLPDSTVREVSSIAFELR